MKKELLKSLEGVERAVTSSRSQQPRYTGKPINVADFFGSVLRWSELAADQEPAYSPDSRTRDKWLQTFWTKEPHWAGVISSVNMIDANRGWILTGGRNQVNRFVSVFRNADDGAGWRQYVGQQSTGFYTADIGPITEVARDGEGGPLRAIYHLDPTKCRLTGNRNAPLHYDKTKNPWGPDDFFRLVSMKNVQEEYNGLGISATSRVLDMARLMLGIYGHQMEMIGARAPKGLMLLQNISQEQWDEAMRIRDARLDSDMRRYYNAVAVIAQQGVDSIDAKLVALSQLPEGFNLEVFTNLLMYAYALCIGYDPIEFWPVLAGQLGRGRETDIQHRKGTGKGGMNFMLSMQEVIQNELPETVHFEFEQRDQEGVLLDAKVAQAWSDVVMTLRGKQKSTTPGPDNQEGDGVTTLDGSESVISAEEARTLLAMHGVIPDYWISTDEQAKATDVKEIQREKLLENEGIRRAIYQFPEEPIIRYEWTPSGGRTKILFQRGGDAIKATRYSLVKPVALIPVFEEIEEVKQAERQETEAAKFIDLPFTQQIVEGGWNIRQGETEPLKITVRDKNRQEIDVSQSSQIVFSLYDKDKLILLKELNRGIKVDRSVISVNLEPEDTLFLTGIYSCSVRVVDDLGRTFTVYKGNMAILQESIHA